MSTYDTPGFLDTNIWIAYFITRKVGTLLTKIAPIPIITCAELLNEIREVALRERITRKIPAADLNNYYKYIDTQLHNIEQRAHLHIATPIPIIHQLPAADSKDWYIYNLAQLHGAMIVTNDAHLLLQPGLHCLTAAEFFKKL